MKKIHFFVWSLLFTTLCFAQQVNNTQFKTEILQVYQNLDKNKVPHGILLDFGMEFTNLKAFNGTLSDSTYVDSQKLSNIYKTLIMSRVKDVNNGFITPQEYATRWYTQRALNTITLSGLYFKYSNFIDTAYPSKINYSNNQFSDKYVNGIWQNPYQERAAFAMAPSIARYNGLDFNVKLPANLFLSNAAQSVQSIAINFGDGLGYRIVTYNQLINVNYTTAGIYTWQYKITLSNNQTLYSHSKVQIDEGLNAEPLTTQSARNVNNSGNNELCDYVKTTITATVPYAGQLGSATVYIRYIEGNTEITTPLIVAEGFDTGIVLSPEKEGGDNNIDDFINDIESSNSNLLENEIEDYDVIYVDWDNGVDFLQRNAFVLEEVIRWVNNNKVGATQNVVLGQSMGGLIARYALRDIEVNRNFNHDTRLYVSHDSPHLGANVPLSVQHAARHLRNEYVSAPIPLLAGEVILPLIYNFAEGFSDIINLYGANTSVDPFITPLQAFSIADVAAARQQQYNWVKPNYHIDNSIHDAWINEYSTLGYPQGYPGQSIRNIAISNGSECGITQVVNGNIASYIKDAGKYTYLSDFIGILDAVIGVTFARPDIVATALIPGKSYWEIDFQCRYMTLQNENKYIYHGGIKYKKKVLYFIPVSITLFEKDIEQPSTILPYDIYGGGWQEPELSQVPLSGIEVNAFGFIPTASAIDIGSSTILLSDLDYKKEYVGASPPMAPKNTLFDNFYTHFDGFNPANNNTPHISFNFLNGNWLQTELNLNETPETTDCSMFCDEEDVIQGDKYLCNTTTYSIPGDVTSVVWNVVDNNNLVSFNTNLGAITITPNNQNNSGFITLNALINTEKCGFLTPSVDIWVGKPNVTNYEIYGGDDNVPINSTSQFNVDYAEGNTGYYWFITTVHSTCPSGGTQPVFQTGTGTATTLTTTEPHHRYAFINWGNCTGEYVINCRAINPCGTQDISYKVVDVYKPNGNGDPCLENRQASKEKIKVYPNPVKGSTLHLRIPDPGGPCDPTEARQSTTNLVKIYDFSGRELYSQVFETNNITIEKLNFKKGHYVLNVFMYNGEERKQMLVIE